MRRAKVSVNGVPAGLFEEWERGKHYIFRYFDDYDGIPVSLTMPVQPREIEFDTFPPFFDGVLPEGPMLDGLIQYLGCDRDDYFSQLMSVGQDLVGAVTVEEIL